MKLGMNCVSIDAGNGLSPVRLQAITGTNADLLLTEPLETNFSEINQISNIFIKENAFENIFFHISPNCPWEMC